MITWIRRKGTDHAPTVAEEELLENGIPNMRTKINMLVDGFVGHFANSGIVGYFANCGSSVRKTRSVINQAWMKRCRKPCLNFTAVKLFDQGWSIPFNRADLICRKISS